MAMKKTLITLLLLTVPGTLIHADELQTTTDRAASDYLNNRFGVGLMVGEPTGLSLKYWMTQSWAVDGGVGASFHRSDGLQLHSDALWHWFGLIDSSHGLWAPYVGGGVRYKFEDGDDAFGFRVPVGISYMLDHHPIDVFVEVAPILDVTPSVRGSFNFAAGARFWF